MLLKGGSLQTWRRCGNVSVIFKWETLQVSRDSQTIGLT